MQNARFLSSCWLDAATITASSVQGNLPAIHVQKLDPTQVWRAQGCAAEWLAWDCGESIAFDTLHAIAHNLSPDAMLQLRLAASAADVTADPAVDSGSVSAWPSSGKPTDRAWPSFLSQVQVANATGYRFGRLDIFDPTNPVGRVQIGRLHGGPAFEPDFNIDINPALGLMSPDEAGRTAFGRAIGDRRGPPSRTMSLSLSAASEEETLDGLFELQRHCGLGRDFSVVVDPDATTRFHKLSMQARFEGLQASQAQAVWTESGQQAWATTVLLTEVL